MQVRSLPRHVIRNARAASRLIDAQPPNSEAAIRRATVRELRADYPMWGKAKLTVLLRRQGYAVSESTVGRILKRLMTRGEITPVPSLRRKAPRAARRIRPHARRLPKGRKASTPGEIVQRDVLSVCRGRRTPAIKQFTACDPVAKWTCAKACRRATANNAKDFLDKLIADIPFPIQAIQVDGGSGFKADFETECRNRNIDLFELPPRSPELNGHVERNNGAWPSVIWRTAPWCSTT